MKRAVNSRSILIRPGTRAELSDPNGTRHRRPKTSVLGPDHRK
jgi:hypothetical protein